MRVNSIRFWLPISYGIVVLLAVVSLGGVFLITMGRYYDAQERIYLERNASALSEILSSLLSDEIPNPFVQSQIELFSYWTQARIQIFDIDENLLADSGSPETLNGQVDYSFQLQHGDALQSFGRVSTGQPDQVVTTVTLEEGGIRLKMRTNIQGALDAFGEVLGIGASTSRLDTSGNIISSPGGADRHRSPLVVRQPIISYATGDGEINGLVQLSEGPAFGRTILANIQGGILLAGLVAGVVPFWFGWMISLRISQPIQNLAAVTAQMAEGDLSGRADISRADEIGQLGRSFNRMAIRVENSMASLRRFIADAAHEIHTPLTALRTNLELGLSTANHTAYITKSLAVTRRIEKLSDDLLHLSRLESGVDKAEMRRIRLDGLVGELCETYAGQAEQADLGFDVNLTGPVTVWGNPNQLSRAIANILDNAVKFTPPGGEIQVNVDRQAGWMQVSVSDTGIGIVEEDLERLFDRFHRGRNASEIPGSGLGLAIAHTIITRHGGEIQVEPNDPGAIFVIRLPAGDSLTTSSDCE